MVTVRFTERRGAVLTPSGLACLAGVPTVNVSVGCAHRCVYCYGRGYSQYPGERAVLVYRDTAARVEKELARKRRRPAVWERWHDAALLPANVCEVGCQPAKATMLSTAAGISSAGFACLLSALPAGDRMPGMRWVL